MASALDDPQTFAIIGAAMEVHRELGPGFLEAVYHEALTLEFRARDIPFQSQAELPVRYKQQLLQCSYRADFVCYHSLIVELKTVDQLGRTELAQVINYLKATGCKTGLLINFKTASLDFRRVAL